MVVEQAIEMLIVSTDVEVCTRFASGCFLCYDQFQGHVSKSLSRRIHETRCATGLWAATGAEECSQCATGSEPSVAAAGAVSCTACPVGRARAFIAGLMRSTHETAANEASLRPQLFCVDCAAGHVAAMGSSACTRCKDGSAPENISRGACVACAPGRAGVGGACSDCQERTRRAAGAYAAEEITGSVVRFQLFTARASARLVRVSRPRSSLLSAPPLPPNPGAWAPAG